LAEIIRGGEQTNEQTSDALTALCYRCQPDSGAQVIAFCMQKASTNGRRNKPGRMVCTSVRENV